MLTHFRFVIQVQDLKSMLTQFILFYFVIVSPFSDFSHKELMPLSDVFTSKQIMLMEGCFTSAYKEKAISPSSVTLFAILDMIDMTFSFFLTVVDFQKLQEAKEVLCNEAKRKNYDLWKRSGVTIPFRDWQALNDSVKTVCNVFTSFFFFQNTL